MQKFSDLYLSPLRDDFIKLLRKFFRNHASEEDLHVLARLRLNDEEFIMQLRRLREETLPGREDANHSMNDVTEYRGNKRAADVINILTLEEFDTIHDIATSGGRYLDIGAHDGYITTDVAKEFNFDPDNVYAIDVHVPENAVDRVKEYDGSSLLYANNFFCLVSFYQVLHHVQNLDLLKDVSRCTAKGGYLIIREHNRPGSDDNEAVAFDKLVELEHVIYDMVMLSEYETYAEFKKNYYAKCRSKYKWSDILRKQGFVFLRSQEVRIPGGAGSNGNRREPTRHYYALYRKSKKFRNEY
jgi:SAM-dependent methyltransferase